MLSILLVLDGSPMGRSPTELALRWAKRFNASVTALGIVDEYALSAPETASIGGDAYKERRDQRLLSRVHERVDAALGGFEALAERAGVEPQVLKRTAEREKELAAAAQSHDLVVMARDTHFVDEHESDGTLESLLGVCSRPIVAVPPVAGGGSGNLIAYSGGTNSAQALQDLVANGLHLGGQNWLINIDRRSIEAATARVQRGVEYLRRHGGEVEPLPIVSRQPIEDILIDQSQQLGVELLVMGSHRRSRVMAYLTGSVVHEVLGRSLCPVFLAS